jgi:hypothetical protein
MGDMVDWVPERFAYRRSPFQVALLTFATFGLYFFVWAFWARRWCAATLERQDQPIWKTVALIIPIFNLFLMFDLGKMIEGTLWRAQLPPARLSLPWVALSIFFISALQRLPDPYWLVCLLFFLPIAYLQFALVRAQIALTHLMPTPLRWYEWVVAVLGFAWLILAAIGVSLPDDNGAPARLPWFGWAVFGFGLLALVAIGRASNAIPVEEPRCKDA